MWEFLSKLFSSDFMPHGHCFFWQPSVLWLHVGADSLIALSYFAIPVMLLTIVRKRRDLIYNWMFLLFATFIFLCGTTHIFGIWSMWNGTYRLEGVVKLLTGIVSLATAVLLWRLIPKILSVPSHQKLEEEINRRIAAQASLELVHQELEGKVLERTAELELANQRFKHWAHIVDSSDDGIIAITVDGTITSWNPGAENIFGYRLNEIVGNSIDTVIPDDYLSEFTELKNRVFLGETHSDFDTTWIDKRGHMLEISITLSPLVNQRSEKVEGFSIIVRDITERKRQEERFRRAVEAAPNAMLLVTKEGRIVLANNQASSLFGYSHEELIGNSLDILLPPEQRDMQLKLRADYLASPVTKPVGSVREVECVRKDKVRVPVQIGVTPIETSEGSMVIVSVVDVTERKEAERRIQSSLEQKELLLKEVHHRVKNNLQVISSLLKIQSRYVMDEKTRSMFRESEDRVRSMALVHDKLYRSAELNRVEFKSYVQDLTNELCRTYMIDRNQVAIDSRIGDVELNIEKAIPCGLILNELVSNALKHAFQDMNGRSPTLSIALQRHTSSADSFELVVADNGKGLPADVDFDKAESMGLRVIRTLCDQLRAKLEISSSDSGTTFKLIFLTNEGGKLTKERRHEPQNEHIGV